MSQSWDDQNEVEKFPFIDLPTPFQIVELKREF